MKTIELTQGREAIVDDCDYERLVAMGSWSYHGGASGYAARNGRQPNGKQQSILMHRVIMDAPDGAFVDHINGDGLDNRRSNLRICSIAQNGANRGANSNSRSGIKGVYWHRQHQK